ncbi:hypothetical protein BDP27DRAFT_1367489 [Rhodocollybia butyracea]|uniref:Hydrophobin n=1 Tax=Rhodocollybia butyracea TaxID=206335 RepID=A0A9P5PL91_9AGAR|nr:hypothetical protein BDP27DRAFT_1367489 [Rhodocollybia butyracea]
MQFKLALVSFAVATLALPSPTPRNEAAGDCSTGDTQCCEQVITTIAEILSDPRFQALIPGALTLLTDASTEVVPELADLFGVTCSSIDVAGGGTCNQLPVCCDANDLGGAISINCVPMTL